ncbi:MAG: hypothetical protein ACSHW2_09590 [Parasphingopyxis sp.]
MNDTNQQGLDLFASAWIMTWQQLGGTVHGDWIGQPQQPEGTPPVTGCAAHLELQTPEQWEGALKALAIMRVRVPGAIDAIKRSPLVSPTEPNPQ